MSIVYWMLAMLLATAQPRDTRFIVVSWPDAPEAITIETANAICWNAATEWAALSKDRVVMTCSAEAHAFTTPIDLRNGCQSDWTGAVRAAGNGDFWPIYVQDIPGCGSYNANMGRPGAWLPGGGQAVHEIGHNLGFGHTGRIDCWSYPFNPDPAGPCMFYERAQGFDVMGTGSGLNAPHAARLGVPPIAQVLQRVTQTVDVSTAPARLARDGAIEYWIETQSGKIVVTYTGWIPFSSIDAMLCATLTPGQDFVDSTAGITITATSTTVATITIGPPVTLTPTTIPTATTPTPTPSPGRNCGFWIFPPCPTATPTQPPPPTATPTIAKLPTSTVVATATPTATPAPTAWPSPTAPPPRTPTPTPRTKRGGGCGNKQAGIVTLLPLALWWTRRATR